MQTRRKKLTAKKVHRAVRVRKHLRGTSNKPRMCVVKSNMHINVQIIDDERGVTLASVSTLDKGLKGTEFCHKNKASAKHLGSVIAEKAKTLGIETIVFDRGSAKYHGILAALADAAREAGLKF